MPPRNDDLFQRLRRAGIRKPVAKALSELTEDAGKKAVAAGHRAVAELRALADEIEKRLPPAAAALATPEPPATAPPAAVPAPSRAARPGTARTPRTAVKAPSAPRARTATARSSTTRSGAAAPKPPAAAAARGANKAKILTALKTGPRTASEISQETGIATATVSAALTRLSKAGEVTKATRGYALPS